MIGDAYLLEKPGDDFVKRQISLEEPSAGQVLVRMVATGICHADIAIAADPPFPLPAILGHEGAGVVEAVGYGVNSVDVGDHVVLTFSSCGECRNCAAKHEAHCIDFHRRNFGGAPLHGNAETRHPTAFFFGQSSFASHAIVDASCAIAVRRDAPLGMLGPLGCGVQTGVGAILNVLRPPRDAVVAIMGAGAVGLSALLAAKHVGCRNILVADVVPERLDLAIDLGASDVIEISSKVSANIPDRIPEIDSALDTTGQPAVIQALLARLRPGGTIGIVGGGPPDGEVRLPLRYMVPGRTLVGITEGDSHPPSFIPELVDLFMAGRLPFDRLVRFYSADEINDAIVDARDGRTIKPVIRFAPDS